MFKVILAATDGSAHGTRATEIAANIAGRFDARLVLLSVNAPGPLPRGLAEFRQSDRGASPHSLLARVPGSFYEAVDATSQGGSGEGHAMIKALAREALNHGESAARKAGVTDRAVLLEDGDPATVILEQSDRCDADLIVLGRRGLGSVAELVLGSVSHKVVQHTKRSCLTVC